MTSRNSRKKAPKNGTTGHSGIANERASANSYSDDKRAEERLSKTGTGSFTLFQKGFSLLDLRQKHWSCLVGEFDLEMIRMKNCIVVDLCAFLLLY